MFVSFLLNFQYAPHVDGGRHIRRPGSPTSSSSTITTSNSNLKRGVRGRMLYNWRSKVQETDEAVVTHEVDQYLNAPLEPIDEKDDNFDILCRWKINGPKYPVITAIARDVLAIQTSTVASESCFSTGGRVISPFKSSLTPKSVEALVFMQNWLLGDDIAKVKVEDEVPSIENTEFYEKAELGTISICFFLSFLFCVLFPSSLIIFNSCVWFVGYLVRS